MSKIAIEEGYNAFDTIDDLPLTKDQKEMVLEWFAQKIWNTLDEPGHCKSYDPLIIEGNTAHSYIFNLNGLDGRTGSGRHHGFKTLVELEERLCKEMQNNAEYFVRELSGSANASPKSKLATPEGRKGN